MKLEMVTSSDKSRRILSKDAFVTHVNEKFEELIKNYECPIEKLVKEIKETTELLAEAGEQATTLNRAADVIIRHQESFLHRTHVLPKRTVGVNVNIVKQGEGSSEQPRNYTRFPLTPSESQQFSPSTIDRCLEKPIKTEPDSPVSLPSSSAASFTPSAVSKPIASKRNSVDVVDLASEEDKATPMKQLKTLVAVDKPGTRLLGALTREPISSKSQPVLIQDGPSFPPKFTALPVASTSMPQVLQLSPSQLSTLSQSGVIAQQPVNVPKTVSTTVPGGQRITYLLQSGNLGFASQGNVQANRPSTVPTGVATRLPPLNNTSLINATRNVTPASGTIIVTSKLPSHLLSTQSIGEPRVVRPMPSNVFKHPAPLPEQPKPPQHSRSVLLELPPKPSLKISKPGSGIVLSWNLPLSESHASIKTYQLYGYEETSGPADTNMWKKVGEVKALPLPMACTLTQFADGRRYHFAIRAMDIYYRIGAFSDIASIYLKPLRG